MHEKHKVLSAFSSRIYGRLGQRTERDVTCMDAGTRYAVAEERKSMDYGGCLRTCKCVALARMKRAHYATGAPNTQARGHLEGMLGR